MFGNKMVLDLPCSVKHYAHIIKPFDGLEERSNWTEYYNWRPVPQSNIEYNAIIVNSYQALAITSEILHFLRTKHGLDTVQKIWKKVTKVRSEQKNI